MTKTIDEEVVSLKFNNKQFEEETSKSLGTLKKLKEALKFSNSTKVIEDLDHSISEMRFDGALAGIDLLSKRFSGLGIVGMTVISNITTALQNKLVAGIKVVSDSIVSGGIKRAMNIENAHFQLQALLKDETKVQAVMANAMESVDGTAYAYDEAAKAASQFAASGIEAGNEMLQALKGITGVAAMTNSQYEDISRIFTTVAGNGRLMGDQLLQLSSRGLNAASTIAQYLREVRGLSEATEADVREMVTKGQLDFQLFSDAMTYAFGDSAKRANETFTGALSNMKSALARIGAGFVSPLIEQNGVLVELFNTLRVKINDVKSELVFDEQKSAISGLAKETGITNDELSTLFNTIKENGSVSINELNQLSSSGVNGYEALLKYMNGVSDGTIKASYATKKAVDDLTKGFKITEVQLKEFVKKEQINTDMFVSAMEKSFGDSEAITKQFTDIVIDNLYKVSKYIANVDTTKPIKAFYLTVDVLKDSFIALESVLKPTGKAFKETFNISSDDILGLIKNLDLFIKKLKLTEKQSNSVKTGTKGLLSVLKLISKITLEITKEILGINKPIGTLLDLIIYLYGSLGDGLLKITNFIDKSKTATEVLNSLKKTIQGIITIGSSILRFISSFIKGLSEINKNSKNSEQSISWLSKIDEFIGGGIEDLSNTILDFSKALANMIPKNADKQVENLRKRIDGLKKSFDWLKKNNPFNGLKSLIDYMGQISKSSSKNSGTIGKYFQSISDLFNGIDQSLKQESIVNKTDAFMNAMNKFVDWFSKEFLPTFSNMSIGAGLTIGSSAGIMYFLNNVVKSLNKLNAAIPIKGILSEIKNVLKAYSKEINANALIKTAGAIAILCGSLLLLSNFTDPGKLLASAIALGIVSFALAKSFEALNKATSSIDSGINAFVKSLKRTLKNAINVLAFGTFVKDFAFSIAAIAASIYIIAHTYSKDKTSFEAAIGVIKQLFFAMSELILILSLASIQKKSKINKIKSFSVSLIGIAASLSIAISALNKLFKMKIPTDASEKIVLIGGVFLGLGWLSSKLSNNMKTVQKGSKLVLPVIEIASSLYIAILALKKLDDLDFSLELIGKVGILITIFGALSAVTSALTSIGKGKTTVIKASGTIVALSAFLIATTAALAILHEIPGKELIGPMIALAGVLASLGLVFAGMGKIDPKLNLSKTITASVFMLATMTIALAGLSTIPLDNLLPALGILMSCMLALGKLFKSMGEVKKDSKTLETSIEIAVLIGELGYVLYKLSQQPWDQMLAAGVSMSACILAYAKAFKMIGSTNIRSVKAKKIGSFLLYALSAYEIGVALGLLAFQPWDRMAGAGLALSACITAFSKAFVSFASLPNNTYNMEGIKSFLAFTSSAVVIGIALRIVSEYDWQNLLASAAGLSACILAYSHAFGVFSLVKENEFNKDKIGMFLIFCASTLEFAYAISEIAVYDWKSLSASAGALSGCILAFTLAFGTLSELSNISDSKKSGATLLMFLAMTGIFLQIVKGPLSELAQQPWDGMLAASVSLGILANSLSLACILLGVAGKLGGAAIAGIGILDVLMVDLLALFVAMGNIVDFLDEYGMDTASGSIQKGIDAMTQISYGLGQIMQSFFNGVIETQFESLEKTGEYLSKFAKSSKDFFDIMSTVDGSKISESSLGVAEAMASLLGSEIIQTGSNVFEKFLNTGPDKVGKTLSEFAKSALDFFNIVGNVNSTSLTSLASIMEAINGLMNQSFWDSIMSIIGIGGMDKLGEQLKYLATAIVEFESKISDVQNLTSIKESMELLKIITDIEMDVKNINKTVKSINKLLDLCLDIEKADPSALGKFVDGLKDVSKDAIDKFNNEFINSGDNAKSAVKSFAEAGIEGGSSKNKDYKKIGNEYATQVCIGLESKNDDANLTGTTFGEKVLTPLNNMSSGFLTAGKNAAQGFINGINSMMSSAEEAGFELGSKTEKATKKSLDERSPSKKMKKVGDFAGLGYVMGLTPYLSKAAKMGEELGDTTIKNLSNSINNDLSDIDLFNNPTIKPIVDLSDVRKSSKEAYGLFNESLRLSTKNANILSGGIQSWRNRSSAESAINSLRNDILNMRTGDTYTINGINYVEQEDVDQAIQVLIKAAGIRKKV